jgi:hypothetical protein
LTALLFNKNKTEKYPNISNFTDCANAGYPIAESYPRQCFGPDGQSFYEEIGNENMLRDLIRVDNPRPNTEISSPLTITGQARGSWYFEADFPIRLEDESGNVLASGVAQAQSDWMTNEFVPYRAQLSFTSPGSDNGFLILEKSNPSGLTEQTQELRIGISFSKSFEKQLDISLYFYNTNRDPQNSCDPEAVVPVSRRIALTQTPIQDTISLLLQGALTQKEKNDGYVTEFPLTDVKLSGAGLREGILTLSFWDPQNKTSGGSCRVRLLWAQVERTARQFPQVREVRFQPPTLFQP